jgi:hypothetical protein|nr:MAG TPA: hypothetical protein [Caudoviricetes sp.]
MSDFTYFFICTSIALSSAIVIWLAGKIALLGVGSLCKAIDGSPYALMFVLWWFKKTNREMPEAMKKRFLSQDEFQMVVRMQSFINALGPERLSFITRKYSELEHPLFIWHDQLFCRSNGNDVINIATGQAGKIPENEVVTSMEIFGSLIDVSNILDINKKMKEKFEQMGW